MKFRRKPDGFEITVEGDWEPVNEIPKERWVDVTQQCDMINCGQYLGHHIGAECYAIFGYDGNVQYGYRLRKVLGRIHSGDLAVPQWSFVVEKREP